MKSGDSSVEKEKSGEDLHNLRLMALLHELVRKKGRRGAATVLGIDHRTVAASMEGGELSWRVREALERALQSGAGSAAARQQKRNDALEQRIGEMQQRMKALEKEMRSALDTRPGEASKEVNRRLEEVVGAWEEIAQRVARLEQAADGEKGDVEPRGVDSQKKAGQVYHSSYLGGGVISEEPHPGEEISYGPGMPLVEEWRRLNKEREVGTKLTQAKTRERIMELEIAMLGEYKLTLPPGTSPLDSFTRGAELD